MNSYQMLSIQKLKMPIEMKYRIIIMDKWWSSKAKHYHISGSFNVELYLRIMKLKANDTTGA
jgi:hypothetical protein